MIENYSGEVTLNENLYVKQADGDFLRFTGLGLWGAAADVFYPCDIETLKNAMNGADSENCCALMHLKRADGIYRQVLAYFKKIEDSGEQILNIKMSELTAIAAEKEELKAIRRVYDTYLGLAGSILLMYRKSDRQIEIFYVSDGRRECIYKGQLTDWTESIKKSISDERCAAEFEALVNDINSGSREFSHKMTINGFLGGNGAEICNFRCKTVKGAGEDIIVLGCIETDNKSAVKELLVDPAVDKDNFLDMLNKRAATDRAKRIISNDSTKRAYFVILDLDNFKNVNDTYGHIVGDEVLVTAAEIINENLNGRGIVGRIGGDEILIVTVGIDDQTELRNMLRSIRTTIEYTFRNDSRALNVTCSMGVSAYPDNGNDFGSLYSISDKMLYLAKSKGKNRYVIYTPEIHDPVLRANEAGGTAGAVPEAGADKISIMHRLVENYLIRRTYNNEKIFSEVGPAFNLKCITAIYDDFTVAFEWTPEGVFSDISRIIHFKPSGELSRLFDRNKLLAFDGMYKFQGRAPEVEECMKNKGLKSAVICRIDKDGRFSGYLMYGRDTERQKWSEYELMALSTVGKVFEVSMLEIRH